MIVGIVGKQGRGKTLLLSILAYYTSRLGSFNVRYLLTKEIFSLANVKKVYANYKLSFPFEPVLTPDDLEKMTGGSAFLDEFYQWAKARKSMSGINAQINNIAMAARKRDVDVFWTSHRFGKLDKDIRAITDVILAPEYNLFTGAMDVTILDAIEKQARILGKFSIYAKPFYSVYDTKEEIADAHSHKGNNTQEPED